MPATWDFDEVLVWGFLKQNFDFNENATNCILWRLGEREREREFSVESVCKSLTQPEQGICCAKLM